MLACIRSCLLFPSKLPLRWDPFSRLGRRRMQKKKQPHFCSCFSVSAPCCRRRGPRRLRDCGFRNSRNPSLVFGRSSSPNRSSGFGLANGVSGNPLWRLIPDLAGDGCKKEAAAFLQLLLCVSAVLSSRAVASQVLSPLMSLTSVFGMGTGGPSSLLVLTSSSRTSQVRFMRLP